MASTDRLDGAQQRVIDLVAGWALQSTDPVTGKRIRAETGVSRESIESLVPRWLTRITSPPNDTYHATPAGLLSSSHCAPFSRALQNVLRTLVRMFSEDPDVRSYEWSDVNAKGGVPQTEFIAHLSVIRAAQLHAGGNQGGGTFEYHIPAEIEAVVACGADVPSFMTWFDRQRALESAGHPEAVPTTPVARTNGSGRQVFIVHGHDDDAKDCVAEALRGLGIEYVILHEQPNAGRTIIEKFEDFADAVGFAVVLLTPDDRGGRATDDSDQYANRARQNVILELGFFLAKLGRERVCPLRKGKVEVPSDYSGVVYVEFDDSELWRAELERELRAAGVVLGDSGDV